MSIYFNSRSFFLFNISIQHFTIFISFDDLSIRRSRMYCEQMGYLNKLVLFPYSGSLFVLVVSSSKMRLVALIT